ncbi:DedA family protein [Sulfuracidifex metallicus]|uniref:DedA family protein n=1 Tax=Sulfuracidifex metallicus DSM 6482 = JCM 9184 TaxID=523847 RepID=A0A6A9QQ57_SULME|nr:DedA family protein [Sulfuracidifex metallicus]MUN29311.1 DedA family protein [Sulfuracidifex metallicus DSM 6482 = JCM 9184]WOE50176.1 DedA family protein [Sulfuracidifex metallicus DSM 6482 = JCM 9184]
MNLEPTSYTILLVLMFLEALGLPVPSEVIMPLAGYFSSQGQYNLVGAILIGTLGAMIGSLFDYFIASRIGEPILLRYGKYIKLNQSNLMKMYSWFNSYGVFAVFFARFLPALRALISYPAGLVRMNIGRFSIATLLGQLIWNGVLAYVGFLFGKNYSTVVGQIDHLVYVITIILIIVLILVVILYKHNFLKFKR